MPVLASTIIDFSASYTAEKQPFVYKITPDSVYVGDTFTVSIYAPAQYELISPYSGIIEQKRVKPTAPQRTQTISISSLSTDYPISELIGCFCANEIIDTTTRQRVKDSGSNALDLFNVVNGALKLKSDSQKLVGSIKVVYTSHLEQYWKHASFKNAGDVILFAQNLTSLEYENVTLSISEKTATASDSIKIEGYPNPSSIFSYAPFAHFIVYPASKSLLIKTDFGKTHKIKTVSQEIKHESISFSGKESNAAYFIDVFESFTGYFFDAHGAVIEPSFSVSEGRLIASVDCYGAGFLRYSTQGTVYAYDAKVTTTNLLGGGIQTDIRLGTVFAFDPEKIGIAASYDIPVNALENGAQPVDFATVYSEIVLQETGAYEKPPNFPTDVIFPNQPIGNFPIAGDPYVIQKRVHIAAQLYNNESVDYTSFNHKFEDPYNGSDVQNDIVYHIDESIPTTATDYAKEQMKAKIDALKVKYGIA
jgi:hypothetical protein